MARVKSGKAATESVAGAQPRQHSLVWLQGLLCGALVTVATPTALLLGVLLGPALLAMLLDREPGRPTSRSVALFAMAASVSPLKTLWIAGHTMTVATAMLSDVQIIATTWSAAAAGWLMAQLTPIAVRTALEALSIARAVRLRAERAKLVEAWGFDEHRSE